MKIMIGIKQMLWIGIMSVNKQLQQQQNLRALTKQLFLNLMSVNGVMAKTIIRNYNNKKTEDKNNDNKQLRNMVTNGSI